MKYSDSGRVISCVTPWWPDSEGGKGELSEDNRKAANEARDQVCA